MRTPGGSLRRRTPPGRIWRAGCGLVGALLLARAGPALTQEAGLVARAAPYGASWSAAHADAQNTDYAPVDGGRALELAWERNLGGMINLGPTSDGEGRVFVTSTAPGCHLQALDRDTGRTLWCAEEVDRFAVASSALVDQEGRLYVADSAAMHAFDRDGRRLWATPIVGVPLSAQFTPGGALVFITNIGRIYLLRRESGELLAAPLELIPGAVFDPSQGARACMRGLPECPSANTPAVDPRTGRIFFTFWTPGAPAAGLRAMQIVEGEKPTVRPLWTLESLPGGSASSPDLSPDGRRLYLTDNAGGLQAIEAATGRPIWRFEIGHEAGGSPTTTPDGLIIPAGGGQGELMALQDRGSHAERLWSKAGALNRGIAPVTRNDLAYATVARGEGENDLVVLEARSGRELERHPLPGRTLFTIGTTIDRNGVVYVPSINGRLFAFRPVRTGVSSNTASGRHD